jgi:hypothetical protein
MFSRDVLGTGASRRAAHGGIVTLATEDRLAKGALPQALLLLRQA